MNSKAVTRRTAIGAAVVAAAPLLFPGRIRAQGAAAPPDTFVILLDGPYEPVVHGPNLGLSTVDLSDGSYSKTKIYPFSGGTPGNTNRNKAIGDFYVQFTGENTVCAYHIPGGSFAMRFIDIESDYVFNDDGANGVFLDGTFELTVLEATGIYRSFVGGHNHMDDHLHLPATGPPVEHCFCNISRP
jgi:hypothetical protein